MNLAAWEREPDWAFDALEEVDGWFEDLTPVLPLEGACAPS